jgi:hypothetical protein
MVSPTRTVGHGGKEPVPTHKINNHCSHGAGRIDSAPSFQKFIGHLLGVYHHDWVSEDAEVYDITVDVSPLGVGKPLVGLREFHV